MKKLLLLPCCFSLVLSAKAQVANIDGFYGVGTTWTEAESTIYGQGASEGKGYRLSITGDTVINAVSYLKMVAEGIGGYTTGYDQNHIIQTYYDTTHTTPMIVGAVRADSGKVFFINLDTGNHMASTPYGVESLLYNFNLHVGDSVAYKTNYRTVQAIDTVQLLSGQFVRRYTFYDNPSYPFYNDYWYEGFGSSLSFIRRGNNDYSTYSPQSYRLICYENSTYNWKNYDSTGGALFSSCYDIAGMLSLPSVSTEGGEPQIYPTNLMSGASMHIHSARMTLQRIVVADVTGHVVMQISSLPDKHSAAIPMNLVPGMYFIKIEATGQIFTRKILVQ